MYQQAVQWGMEREALANNKSLEETASNKTNHHKTHYTGEWTSQHNAQSD